MKVFATAPNPSKKRMKSANADPVTDSLKYHLAKS